jgi:hypothetical protein
MADGALHAPSPFNDDCCVQEKDGRQGRNEGNGKKKRPDDQ